MVIDRQAVSQATFDSLMQEFLAGTYKANKQPVPKPGSAEFKSGAQKVVAYLVQKTELEQQAKKLGIVVTTGGHRRRNQEGHPSSTSAAARRSCWPR